MSLEPRIDRVGITIGGKRFEAWTGYTITNDVFNPCDSFSLTTGPMDIEVQTKILPGRAVSIYFSDGEVERKVMAGVTKRFSDQQSKNTTQTTIDGKDRADILLGNSVPQGYDPRSKTLLKMAEDLCGPFEIPVFVTNEANRLAIVDKKKFKSLMVKWGQDSEAYNKQVVDTLSLLTAQYASDPLMNDPTGAGGHDWTEADAKAILADAGYPKPLRPPIVTGIFKSLDEAKAKDGESIWSFLSRYAARTECAMWMSADGQLILQRPRYDQEPTYTFYLKANYPEENNIVSSTYTLDISEIPTSLQRSGRTIGKGDKRTKLECERTSDVIFPSTDEATQTAPGVYTFETLGIPEDGLHVSSKYIRAIWEADSESRNLEDLTRLAHYSLKAKEQNFQAYDITVRGHDQDGKLYVPDTTCRVVDERRNIDRVLYIYSCTYTGSVQDGMKTQIRTTPLGAWAPTA